MRSPRTKRAQRGLALIVIVTLVALVAAYLLVARLRASSEVSADRRSRNAEVLNRAKQALIGYVARQAALAGEPNPGRLPCPEHPAYIGDPAREGTAGPGVAVASPACTLVGRFPWRTLGVDKLVDAWNEPLWYVVSPNVWSLQTSATLLNINSNTPGSLTVDGTANAAVALIVSPGPAMNVQAAAGCTARAQARGSTPPDPRDYLECFNTATSTFTTTGPSASFNDQVVRVTVADVMPEIEAAVAERIRREIVPVLKGVYASAQWGLTAANPLFPFAAPFANPGPGGGTSAYQGEYAPTDPSKCPGTLSRCQGLLPLTYTSASCGGDPRCTSGFVSWNTSITPTVTATNGVILDASCGFSSGNPRCDGHYSGLLGQTVQLNMTARASNVAMALKSLDTSGASTTLRYTIFGFTLTVNGSGAAATFNADGSANVTSTAGGPGGDALLPLGGVSVPFRITTDIGILPDHAFLNATSDPTYGWFWRNEWYRLLYYAPALGNTAAGAPTPSCTSGLNCLSVTNVSPAGKQRAILILAGRNIKSPPATRPSGNRGDYLEFGNADGNTIFEQQPISTVVNPALKAPFNDRIIVLDANP